LDEFRWPFCWLAQLPDIILVVIATNVQCIGYSRKSTK
jgi:hypothetical protein